MILNALKKPLPTEGDRFEDFARCARQARKTRQDIRGSVSIAGRRTGKRSSRCSRQRQDTQWCGDCFSTRKRAGRGHVGLLAPARTEPALALARAARVVGRHLYNAVWRYQMVGQIASLFLGQEVRLVVLLDGNDGGRARCDTLMKELCAGYEEAVLMLSDMLGQAKYETEDIIGEATILFCPEERGRKEGHAEPGRSRQGHLGCARSKALRRDTAPNYRSAGSRRSCAKLSLIGR